jgi:hypothetical protein
MRTPIVTLFDNFGPVFSRKEQYTESRREPLPWRTRRGKKNITITRFAATAVFVLGLLAISTSAANAQCPGFGADTTCGVVITITDTGATAVPTGQPPYDSVEDTLVGVVNNSRIPITSLVLHSNLNIFAFDGDGIDTYGAPGNARDTTGYGGPNSYFTNPSADGTTGTVNFIIPLRPHGGSTYFSLEEKISSVTACSTLINNALKTQVSGFSFLGFQFFRGKNICATFTPQQGYTLAQAAQVCGFKEFDWIQNKTVQFDPSPFYARNIGGAFDPAVTGSVRLTSKRVPRSDPPQGGGYVYRFGGDVMPDNSFPFYYDPNVDLPGHEDGSAIIPACTLPISPGRTLTFHDAPANGCLPGGVLNGQPVCMDPVLAPGAKAEPKGSFGGFVTHLAGVNFDGTATDLGIGFTWTSNFNGTTGGTSIQKTELAADENGTGGIAITSVNQITTYGGITVTGVNGAPPAPATLGSGSTCNGLYSGTFNGDVTVSAGQTCTFINGYITGNVNVNGGNLVLSGVLIGKDVQIVNGATFSIGPSTTINGNLEIHNIPPGAAQNQVCGSTVSGNLQFHNNGTPVQIGSASESVCVGNVIGGNLEVHNNTGSTGIFNNTVGGNLDDHNNTAPTQVFSNSVRQNLQCVSNSLITGAGNAAGRKQGQCTGF